MRLRTVARALGVIVLLVIVVPFVVYAVPGVIGADQSFIILSGSMEPAMSPGDAVVVTDVDPETIREGDVVTYAKQGSETVVTHRVVGIDEINGQLAFETKGDANEAVDREPVPASNLVGKVTLTIPLIGYVIDFVNAPFGFVATVLVPLGLLVLSEAWTFARAAVGGAADHGANGQGNTEQSGPERSSAHKGSADTVLGLPELTDGAESTPGEANSGTSIPDGGETMTENGNPDVMTVSVAPRDLQLTFVLLVVLTPYVAFVALELRSFLSIAVAYAIGFTAIAFTVLQSVAWRHRLARGRDGPRAGGGGDGLDGTDDAATEELAGDSFDFGVEVRGTSDGNVGDDEPRGRTS